MRINLHTYERLYHQHLICILFLKNVIKMRHPNTITRLGAAFIRFESSWFPQTKQAWIQSDNLIFSCRRLWFYCLQIRSPANYHNSFIAICSNRVLQSNVRVNINLSPSVWRWNPRLLYERLHCFGPSCTRWRLQLLVVLLSITYPSLPPEDNEVVLI